MKKVLKWFGILVGVLVLAIGIFAFKIYSDTKSTVNKLVDKEIEETDKRDDKVNINKKQPFSMLFLGVDQREGDAGRSDTMIVMTVNPNTNTSKMLSIPRDTYTEIIGRGTMDKINHAFAFGGIEMSRKSVENLLDIPIDYVAQVNMESFKDIIDIVGGITVTNELDFSQDGHHFPQGVIELDGTKALSYVRMRKQDPGGDFGRQNRQKQVVQGIIKSAISVDAALNYKDVFTSLENNVRTNATFDDLFTIQKNYRAGFKQIDQLYMSGGNGTKIEGIYYYLPNEQEMAENISTLKTHLEIQ